MRKFKIFSLLYILNIVYFSDFSFALAANEVDKAQQNTSIIFSFFSTDLLLNIVFACVAIIGTLALAKFATARMTNYLEGTYAGEEKGREELVGVLSRTTNISILSIGFAITLTILGIDMGIFLGGLGFGIGFTLKIFLTNFISGILMVTQGFYHLGDTIEIGGRVGKIKNIHALFTSVQQFNGIIYYIPNVKFLEEEVSNYQSNDKRRVDVNVGVDYDTDIVKAKKILIQVTEQFPNILMAPKPKVFVEEMADNGINLSLRFWLNSTDSYFVMKSNVTETVNLAFKQAGVVIPFPQVTLSNRQDFNVKVSK